jgi:hypothetical protein
LEIPRNPGNPAKKGDPKKPVASGKFENPKKTVGQFAKNPPQKTPPTTNKISLHFRFSPSNDARQQRHEKLRLKKTPRQFFSDRKSSIKINKKKNSFPYLI